MSYAVSPATERFTFHPDKFRELTVYIANKSSEDPTFGAIKLNKVMYYADFAAYRINGQPITGARYQKLHEGPAPRELLKIRADLIESGDAQILPVPYFTGVQKRLVVFREADQEIFAPRELELVDQIIAYFWGKTAREVSDFSHGEPGWVLSDDREVIPYETAWLKPDPLGQDAEERLREFASGDM